jgi:hypothetical protein
MAKKQLKVDIVEQVALGKEVPPEADVVAEAFKIVCQTAKALHDRGERRGALIVIGSYASAGEVESARGDLRPNPFKGQYVSVGDKFFQRMILQGAVGEGAVVADESGQILGGGIMLAVGNYSVEVPDGGFMRHLAAASYSIRKEVKAVITLSEESNLARVFQGGTVTATYDPAAAAAEKPEEKAETPPAEVPAKVEAESTQVIAPPPRKRTKKTARKRKAKTDRVVAPAAPAEKGEGPSKEKREKAAEKAKEKPDAEGQGAAPEASPPKSEEAGA